MRALVPCVALLALVSGFHLDALRTNYNDKATHRAMAYFCGLGGDHPVVVRLVAIWGAEVDPIDRLSYCDSYLLPNVLTRALEQAPRWSAFQSVFLAHLLLHLLAVLLAVFAASRLTRLRSAEVCAILLLSLVPWLTIGSWAFPYANDFFGWHSWRTSYPRGAAVLLGLVAALAWARELAAPQKRRLFVSGLAGGVGALLHWQMMVLTLAVAGFSYCVPRWLRAGLYLSDKDAWFKLRRRLLLSGVVVAVLKGAALLVHLVWSRGIPPSEVWATNSIRGAAVLGLVFAVFYFVASLWLVGVWRRVRHGGEPSVAAVGDVSTAVLLGVALLILGSYPWSPTSHEWLDTWTILLYEPSRRLVAVGHLAWFSLGWCVWRSTAPEPFLAASNRALVVGGFLGFIALAYGLLRDSEAQATIRDESLMADCISDVHGKPMRRIDDYTVYHAIANELEGLPCGGER